MRKLLGIVTGAVFGIAFVATCGVSQMSDMRPDGSPGSGDGLTLDIAGSEAAPGPTCTPYQQFCDGNNLVSCTRSGQDASLVQDCSAFYYGTANNPAKCYDTCPSGPGACCALTNPWCVYAVSAPVSLSGTTYSPAYDANKVSCNFAPGCPGKSMSLTFIEQQTTCPSSLQEIIVTVDRTKLAAGQTATLPAAGVSLIYSGDNGSCSSWSGTLTFNSDVPSWKISIAATCTTVGSTGIQVQGTFSGNQ